MVTHLLQSDDVWVVQSLHAVDLVEEHPHCGRVVFDARKVHLGGAHHEQKDPKKGGRGEVCEEILQQLQRSGGGGDGGGGEVPGRTHNELSILLRAARQRDANTGREITTCQELNTLPATPRKQNLNLSQQRLAPTTQPR